MTVTIDLTFWPFGLGMLIGFIVGVVAGCLAFIKWGRL